MKNFISKESKRSNEVDEVESKRSNEVDEVGKNKIPIYIFCLLWSLIPIITNFVISGSEISATEHYTIPLFKYNWICILFNIFFPLSSIPIFVYFINDKTNEIFRLTMAIILGVITGILLGMLFSPPILL